MLGSALLFDKYCYIKWRVDPNLLPNQRKSIEAELLQYIASGQVCGLPNTADNVCLCV